MQNILLHVKMGSFVKHNPFNLDYLLKSGEWLDNRQPCTSSTLGVWSAIHAFKLRITSFYKIEYSTIDEPLKMQFEIDLTKQELWGLEIHAINTANIPLDLSAGVSNIILIDNLGKKYKRIDDSHLLRNSQISSALRLDYWVTCNPKIKYMHSMVFCLPKTVDTEYYVYIKDNSNNKDLLDY